jgi:MFS family permease
VADTPKRRNLLLLFCLYFAQGLPFGFQAEISAFLRQAGLSLSKIGYANALAMPWSIKALWAPLVERYGSERFGRRKTWIVAMQLLLAGTCVLTAMFPPSAGLRMLALLLLLMNLFSATQDIAVDGLAVDTVRGQDLGLANTAQVVGFKAGMIVGSLLLARAYVRIGWSGVLWVIGGLIVLVALSVLPLREPPPEVKTAQVRSSLGQVLRQMLRTLRTPGALWLVLFVGTYKIGEGMVDAMFKPFLIDHGFTIPQIAQWVSTYGMVASIAGSAVGGYLAFRWPLLWAVGVTGVLRAVSVGGEWYLSLLSPPTPGAVIAVTAIEHFCGGALTTAMFAFMMSRVDRAVGAAHYTLLACVELVGKTPGRLLAGVLASALGYRGLFALGTVLSFLFLLTLVPLASAAVGQESTGRTEPPPADPEAAAA